MPPRPVIGSSRYRRRPSRSRDHQRFSERLKVGRARGTERGRYCTIKDPITIEGNKQFLQRLLSNLLDNAIKYTPAGGSIALDDEIKDKDVLIKITDTGVGISQEDLPNIFQRFYRCDTSRSKPGTGLGLSLALAIAKAHWGSISVKSKIAEGTQFIIALPLRVN